MDPVSQEERAGVVCRRVAVSGIRISLSPPSQNGRTVNNQVAGSDEPTMKGFQNGEHKEGLVGRRTSYAAAFALLSRAGNAELSQLIPWQTDGFCQDRPALQPIVHILIG